MARTVIDPVTRVGGHLRIEVEIEDGAVRDAWSSGTMFRGIERIMKGRDPRDAWLLAHRVCGACTGAHALASVRAVELGLNIGIPRNARLIRNLMAGAGYAQGHVVHFYQQHALDWVDAAAALRADPKATARLAATLSDWPNSSAVYFTEVQDRLAAMFGGGQLGPFANGYWGHAAYRLPPEADLLVMAHYFEALDWERKVSRLHTLLGGKDPHPQTYVVGGMVVAPPWGGPAHIESGQHPVLPERDSPVALSEDGLAQINALIVEIRRFVDLVYVPDALAIAGYHDDWLGVGAGVGSYLSFGEFPEGDRIGALDLLPSGRIMAGRGGRLEPVDREAIAESVAHSWYTNQAGDDAFVHPLEGGVQQQYAGPPLPFASLEGSDKYSWLKAPRYGEEPMEVGPLARLLIGYGEGREDVTVPVDSYVRRLGISLDELTGTLGRMVARAIEAQIVADRLGVWLTQLRDTLASGDVAVADITMWDPGAWPAEVIGWSLNESPKGALAHWIRIKDAKVEAYDIVDATTWNASPRDARGLRGAIEEALVGTPVLNAERPLEILRTVHSFDPCTACAVHVHGGRAGGTIEVRLAGGGAR